MANKKPTDRSLEIIEELLGCLNKFHEIPIKRAIGSMGLEEKTKEDLDEIADAALVEAAKLKTQIMRLQDRLTDSKPKKNGRFASQRIVSKFLSLS